MKKYRIIYADPPWNYNDKRNVQDLRSVGGSSSGFGASSYYKTMGTRELSALSVENISEKDSVIFLWATSPFLKEAINLMQEWGFKFKTVAFVWVKTRSKGAFARLLGRWTMGSCEYVLLGTRGKPKRISKNVYQLIIAEHTKHSKKPDEVGKAIVDLMGDIPRIELFAREKKGGWDSWGNEIISDIFLTPSKC